MRNDGVSNGAGAVTTVKYNWLNQNGTFYTKGTGATYTTQDVDGPYYVVSEIDAPNGIGGNYVATYAYNGAKADVTAPPVPASDWTAAWPARCSRSSRPRASRSATR